MKRSISSLSPPLTILALMPEGCARLMAAFKATLYGEGEASSKYWLHAGCFSGFFTRLSKNSRTSTLKDLGLFLLKLNNSDSFFYCTSKNKLQCEKFNYLVIVEKQDGGLDVRKFYDRPKQTLMLLFWCFWLQGSYFKAGVFLPG